jgi:UDP-N-acetylmuramate--alanine ligase
MKELNTISRVYFLGIGGIGMSAIARYFLEKNVFVSGYDKTPTTLSKCLEKEGAIIHFEENVDLLDKDAQLVIYTPAIPATHAELNWYKNNGYEVVKRSDILSEISKNSFNICVAGTHGKTTISTMIAHLLRDSGYGCNAFLGGISGNYNTNYWSSSNNVDVVEADEYDRSFLKLSPDIAVITALDADHLDIYGTIDSMREAFREFSRNIKHGGLLLTRFGMGHDNFEVTHHLRYSVQNNEADVYAQNIVMKKGGYEFDVVSKNRVISNFRLNMGGMHNVENMVAAIAIAQHLEIDVDKIKQAVENFKGVRRRFEYVIDLDAAEKLRNNVVFIDDYAHHPEELKALIKSAMSLFGKRKCTVIFQPHLFSRTRDFAQEFSEALDLADEVILLPIYPARELPVEGISSEMILKKMSQKNASVLSGEQLLEYLARNYLETVHKNPYGQLLITAGAGNIDQLVNPIKEIILA